MSKLSELEARVKKLEAVVWKPSEYEESQTKIIGSISHMLSEIVQISNRMKETWDASAFNFWASSASNDLPRLKSYVNMLDKSLKDFRRKNS